MRLSFTQALTVLSLLPLSIANGPSYFYITKPAAKDQWTQGQPHAVNWIHAVDEIPVIDIELGRTSTSGLLLGAREVPTGWGSINLLLGEVPPGDDYYLIFLNVTHGLVYSISEQFTILPANVSSVNSTNELAPDSTKPTVTITGAPGPTMQFAQTYGPTAASASSILRGIKDGHGRSTMTVCTALAASVLAGVWLVV